MFIVDPPYVSEELKYYLAERNTPVLKNKTATACLEAGKTNFVTKEQINEGFLQGKRIYTSSENSLAWVIQNIEDAALKSSIEIMKNKLLFRRLIEPAYPIFFYKEISLERISEVPVESFPYPLILKPKAGIFSVGVYTITNEADWQDAVAAIQEEAPAWSKIYPRSVVSTDFILEQYIYGEEIALDAYYDDEGEPVILNILKHDFDGMSDVSDRFYYTGKAVIEAYLETLTKWLGNINSFFNIKNFPFHAEVRIKDGEIVPIEFNPLRMAGWCSTEISYFAFGYFTYDYYFNNRRPNWDKLLHGKDGKYYTIIVIDKPNKIRTSDGFDYQGACQGLGKPLCLRKVDHRSNPLLGFLFSEVEQADTETMKRILGRNFADYIVSHD